MKFILEVKHFQPGAKMYEKSSSYKECTQIMQKLKKKKIPTKASIVLLLWDS